MRNRVNQALQELKDKLLVIYERRLRGIYLYGSQARGSAHEGSDIDVLVVLEGPVRPGQEITRINSIVSQICLHHNLLISTYPVSADWLEHRQSPFFKNVRKEAVPLWRDRLAQLLEAIP